MGFIRERRHKFVSAALFALFFVILGMVIPLFYYNNIPDSTYFKLKSVNAHDVEQGSTTQSVDIERCFGFNADATVTRQLLEAFDHKKVIYEYSFERTVVSGCMNSTNDFILPANIQPGKYLWNVRIKMTLANGVVRDVSSQTNIFEVENALDFNKVNYGSV